MARSVSPYERHGQFVPQSDANLRLHTFKASENITWLSYLYYRDPRHWRVIADRNSISDARKIEPGTLLFIPPLPVQRGRYESL